MKDLQHVARELGEKSLGERELQAMIDEFDKNLDGSVCLEEFVVRETELGVERASLVDFAHGFCSTNEMIEAHGTQRPPRAELDEDEKKRNNRLFSRGATHSNASRATIRGRIVLRTGGFKVKNSQQGTALALSPLAEDLEAPSVWGQNLISLIKPIRRD